MYPYKYRKETIALSVGPMAVRFQLIATVSYRTSTFLLSPPSPPTLTSLLTVLSSAFNDFTGNYDENNTRKISF